MSKKCSVCALTSENFKDFILDAEDFQLFSLPNNNLLIRRRWIEFINDAASVDDDVRICSMHFLSQDFVAVAGERLRLKKTGDIRVNFI